MNLPSNLLLDAEIAKRRLRQTFYPAAETESLDLPQSFGEARLESVFRLRLFSEKRGIGSQGISDTLSRCSKVGRHRLQVLGATIDQGQLCAVPEVAGRGMPRSNYLSPRNQYGGFVLEIGLSIVVLFFALLGVWVAAISAQPVMWMLLWPAPLVLVFTVFNFLRQGPHWRGGVLVLGRRG